MTKRRRFSTRDREGVLKRFDGKCAMCRQAITAASGLDFDHCVPLALGGEDVVSNLQPLCKGCHKLKTAGDVGTIRKADRQRAAVVGTKAPAAKPLSPAPPARRGRASAPLERKASLPPKRLFVSAAE